MPIVVVRSGHENVRAAFSLTALTVDEDPFGHREVERGVDIDRSLRWHGVAERAIEQVSCAPLRERGDVDCPVGEKQRAAILADVADRGAVYGR